MEIGINDEDFIDEVEDFGGTTDTPIQDNSQQDGNGDTPPPVQTAEEPEQEEDFITSLLKSRGIEDRSKIKFEMEEGSIEELDWDSLSNEDKLNIINSSTEDPETDLDESEIQLISAIRNSGMTPAEYLQHVEESGVERYLQNSQGDTYEYSVDQYSDDELFIADFISRMGDVTDEEAQEALEKAKSNETLFSKQIQAIRNEYKSIEDENIRQAQIEQEQQAEDRFNEFAQSVEEQINAFTEFGGYDLNLDQQDMQDLYDFITGTDAAGNNYFAKALSDPKILVQTAWFALNGKQMIDDITDYFQKEITQVRQQSYNKGLEDAKVKNKPNVVYKEKGKTFEEYNDLDDF